MSRQFKTVKKITEEQLVKEVSRMIFVSEPIVRQMFDALEYYIFEHLIEVEVDTPISIRLFEGIQINGKFMNETNKINQLTGENIEVPNRIKPSIKFSYAYKQNLIEALEEKITQEKKKKKKEKK